MNYSYNEPAIERFGPSLIRTLAVVSGLMILSPVVLALLLPFLA